METEFGTVHPEHLIQVFFTASQWANRCIHHYELLDGDLKRLKFPVLLRSFHNIVQKFVLLFPAKNMESALFYFPEEIYESLLKAEKRKMNRVVHSDANKKLMVSRNDFLSALATDIKPAFGSNEEMLENYIGSNVIVWYQSVQEVVKAGELCVDTLKSPNFDGIFTLLLEGAPNSGTTALAATICKNSGFPFIKVCSSDDLMDVTETAKCFAIKKVYDDAYKSELSCLLIDDLEGLMEYTPVGPRFSNAVLQVLRARLKKNPPKKRKLN